LDRQRLQRQALELERQRAVQRLELEPPWVLGH
jgi:hypothetical protein